MNISPISTPKQPIRSERVVVPGNRKPLLRLHVGEGHSTTLLSFLIEALPDKSRTTIKQLLHDRFISIGLEPTTQFDAPLQVGDTVNIHPAPLPKMLTHKQINILYQDEYLLVIHKDAGLPTVASGEEKDKTALRLLSEHLKSFNPQAKVFHINRLDKDCAGFVVFAKSAELQRELSDNWQQYVRQQLFVAVLEGRPREDEGVLMPPAPDEKKGKSQGAKKTRPARSTPRSEEAQSAGRAEWHIISEGNGRTLLSITLLAGRNNRLRRQLSALRLPIVGDWRNGSQEKELGRVALEGTRLSFIHPVTKKVLDFRQPIPPLLRKLLKGGSQSRSRSAKSHVKAKKN